ncbi:MAG: hypothetical protein QGH70_05475 [Nitrospinota bacterium]|jgi:hypothetical protein|nr:hypothetical protein [Nitrospinota bacterium]MDP6483284.1 hypothetical protein [Nitrospinota bacterium]
MMLDPRVPGRESKEAAERLSRVLADDAAGIDQDIRYHFAKTGFHLTCPAAADPADSLFVSFAQLRELNDDEIRTLIQSGFQDDPS